MIVGFCGEKQSGKGTAATFMEQIWGYEVRKFAQPLKDMLAVLGLKYDHIEGDLKEVPTELLGGNTPRWAMQSLGTEWGRKCMGDSFWVDMLEQRLLHDPCIMEGLINVAVDDVRFPEEVGLIKKYDGVVIKIVRGEIEEAIDKLPKHASENADALQSDFVIYNNASLSDFRDALIETVDWARSLRMAASHLPEDDQA